MLKDSASVRDFKSEAFLMTKLVKLMRKEISLFNYFTANHWMKYTNVYSKF